MHWRRSPAASARPESPSDTARWPRPRRGAQSGWEESRFSTLPPSQRAPTTAVEQEMARRDPTLELSLRVMSGSLRRIGSWCQIPGSPDGSPRLQMRGIGALEPAADGGVVLRGTWPGGGPGTITLSADLAGLLGIGGEERAAGPG